MAYESAKLGSQQTIWDLEVDPVTGLTKAEFSNPIPVENSRGGNSGSRGTSPGSGLSSTPSGLLTPMIGSTTGEAVYSIRSEPWLYERTQKMRKSWVLFQENGSEYTTSDGQTRWCCARCEFPNPIYPSYTITKILQHS